MKSHICVVLIACFVVTLHAAAVEPVVEEVKSDMKPSSDASTSDSELITNEDCHQPKETGRCFALFYRYAFDVEKRECVEFIYGGCAGNSNNFESKEDCEVKCMKKSDGMDIASADSSTTVMPAMTEEDAKVSSTVQPSTISEMMEDSS
ncbi:uncharacterized protein LOC142225369 [Haematobia irritans]|uniref:uncharacterized protein LOC142225369 n=1 Tax=Haematobia irritans TaxID=7368 RepID=UPI003F50A38D